MVDIFENLNSVQREAVETIVGPLLILAGPGSGKTRVIIHRIAYLVNICGVSPRHILAVTFTNKAAREMQERLCQLSSITGNGITMGTFHSICAKILRVDGGPIDIKPGFVIYDQSDQVALVKRCLAEKNLEAKQFSPSAVLNHISAAKSHSLGPQEFIRQGRSYFEEVVGRIYERYQEILKASNALDFDDLLMRTTELFSKHKDVLAKYQNRYLHVMVDEFQDTNLVQYALVKMLSAKYRNLCVVGDPDQSIYSWRSADIRNILNFEKDFPDAKVVTLAQSYRSTKTIIDSASAVIASNKQRKPKKLHTENTQGRPITIIETYNEQEEAQYVVSEIERLISQHDAKLSDMAVMFRTNAQSRALEEAFVRYGMPYKLVAGTRFYERREVKDIIAYLRLIHNTADDISFMRVINTPLRGIGERTVAELSSFAKKEELPLYDAIERIRLTPESELKLFSPRTRKLLFDFHEMLTGLRESAANQRLTVFFDTLIQRIGYKEYLLASSNGEERWDNIIEFQAVVQEVGAEFEPSEALSTLLERIALVSDVDELKETSETVTLITLHQAKGLEFNTVFIVGMEEGILPHFRSFDDPAQMEEECRLCYVGITRARNLVYLVRAFHRSMMGGYSTNPPSRFLKEIPPSLTTGARPWKTEQPVIRRRERDIEWEMDTEYELEDQLPELMAGDAVTHHRFGNGIVVDTRCENGDVSVIVNFSDVGVKKMSLRKARLERVD
ncbi:MAG: UvrD-helicase domain-containing protein [Dehalococcoidia bacterium]|nr:UvrD-helicase domain-containing protein [Dehalococcoidia bacterium]